MSGLKKKQRKELGSDTKAKLMFENTPSKEEQEMHKIEKYTSAKELWEGVIAIHEGTFKMQEREKIA